MTEKVILSPIPLDELKNEFTQIVTDALQSLKPKDEKLLSTEETRKLFSPPISKPTLIKWTSSGKLKSYRIGGRVYYKLSEVIAAATHLKKYGREF